MSDRNGGSLGVVAMAGLAVICCAGPLLVVALASLGVGAWLAAHGLWLLGGLGLLTAGAALFAYPRAGPALLVPPTGRARKGQAPQLRPTRRGRRPGGEPRGPVSGEEKRLLSSSCPRVRR